MARRAKSSARSSRQRRLPVLLGVLAVGLVVGGVAAGVALAKSPPVPTISSGPANPTNKQTASFVFSSTGATSFLCSLNGSAYAACSSGKSYSGLAAGSYTFRVEAVSSGGTSSAASYPWTVDLTPPPPPVITGEPSNPTTATSATFTFGDDSDNDGDSGTDADDLAGAVLWCSLTGPKPVALGVCTSPVTYSGLTAGSYTFSVYAVDLAGNPSGTTSYGWVVRALAKPTISTTPLPASGAVGTAFKDSATLSGSSGTTGETVSFSLYSNSGCSTQVGSTVSGTLAANGTVTSSAGVTPAAPGTYYWQASYAGDANNSPVSSCGEPVTVTKDAPTISTTPLPSTGPIGSAFKDSATLTGGYGTAGETVSFSLYNSGCSTQVGSTVSGTLAANGTVTSSAGVTPTAVGTYYWKASYAGDGNNAAVSSCVEAITVGQATPALSTAPSPSSLVLGSGTATDKATLSGGYGTLTGTITYKLYAPGDTNCSGTPAPLSAASSSVSKAGSYQSGAVTPTSAGTWNWVASYSGNANNAAVTGSCSGEPLIVSKASPRISTIPSPGVTVGAGVSDKASLTGAYGPTGSIVFTLYNAPSCSPGSQVFSSTNALSGTSATSTGYTTSEADTYYWKAFYAGDANNASFATPCGPGNETVAVAQASPTIVTSATGSVTVGGAISDTATLSGLVNPDGTGVVVFLLFSNSSCAGLPLYLAVSPGVSANGSVGSGSYTTTAAAPGGDYWAAIYTGDGNDNPVVEGCGGAGETSIVNKAAPSISTTPSPGVAVGGKVWDSAALTNGYGLNGQAVTFRLYSNSSCQTQVFSSTNVIGSGSATSSSFTTTAAGTFYWKASYAGDANNAAFTTGCGSGQEQVVVTSSSGGINVGPTGAPAFSLANMVPGDSQSISGVTVAVTGTPSPLTGVYEQSLISTTCGSCSAGVGTGVLAGDLVLTILDTTTGLTVYQGPLNGLSSSPSAPQVICAIGSTNTGGGCIQTWPAGETHSFTFTVSFPNNGTSDNAYQGTGASLQFVWGRS